MVSTQAFIKPAWLPRPKYILFGLIGLMMLVVIHKDRILLNPRDPIWEHYRPFKWWLLVHGVAAALPLFLGPLQFSERLRRRDLRAHRIIGRIYAGGVLVAAPLGIVVEAIKYQHGVAPLRLLIASISFGSLFLLTTGRGLLLARRRNIQAHRRWMTRSYAIAMVFLEGRCVEQSTWLTRLTEGLSTLLETHYISDLWMYFVFSLLMAELCLWWQRKLKQPPLVRPAVTAKAV